MRFSVRLLLKLFKDIGLTYKSHNKIEGIAMKLTGKKLSIEQAKNIILIKNYMKMKSILLMISAKK